MPFVTNRHRASESTRSRAARTHPLPTTASYTPPAFGAWNPSGGGISISGSGVGKYSVRWSGADPRILGRGNVQVTAVEYVTGTHCKVTGQGTESAQVQCYRPNGTLVDSWYSVVLGS